jgi:hypothetical protein
MRLNFAAPLALAALLSAAPLAAQAVQGRLMEPGGAPVAQALVALVDSAGGTVGTALTDRQGGFALRAPRPGRYTLQAERVGFATTVSPAFRLEAGETVQQRLEADGRRFSLAEIVAVGAARRCTVRPESGAQTATVWNEARKALRAAAWGERQRLFRYRVAQFQRDLDPGSGRVLRETRREQATVAAHPFASPAAAELSARGWIQKTDAGTFYYGPDAAVLLSDEFLNDHCMRLADDRAVAGDSLVGVAFEPVGGRRLPDVRGVLWLDRATAELRRVEYVYSDLPTQVASPRLGGTVEYARLEGGPWIVRRWSIRMPQVEIQQGARTTPGRDPDIYTAYENARLFAIREDGGEVLSTTAGSGAAVLAEAQAASLEGVVWDSTRAAPLAGARVFVSGTALEAVTDSAGRFRIAGLRGGTYTVAFTHYQLGPVAAVVRPAAVSVDPGATAQLRLAVPGLATVATALCPAGAAEGGRGVILGAIHGPEGTVAGATVRASWNATGGAGARPAGFVATAADASGGFALCGVPEGQEVVLTAGQPAGAGARTRVRLAAGTPLRQDLLLVPRPGSVAAAGEGAPQAVPLPGVTATGRSELADFQRRRRAGRGLFLTREEIAARNAHRTVDIFMGMPGVRLVSDGRGGMKLQMQGATPSANLGEIRPQTQDPAIHRQEQRQAAANAANNTGNEYPTGAGSTLGTVPASERAGVGDCQVQFYVDGARFYPSREGDISGDIPLSLVEAVEVYRSVAETPVEFRSGQQAGCGTVVIWTHALPAR